LQSAADQARFASGTFQDRQQAAAITMNNAYRNVFGNQSSTTASSPPLTGQSPAGAPTSGGQVVGSASTPTSLFGQYGASGINAGIPFVTFTTSTGRQLVATSTQDLRDFFNQGFINKVTQNELTRQLNQLQQQANNPANNRPPQQTQREP
jgi:hypothetical protein